MSSKNIDLSYSELLGSVSVIKDTLSIQGSINEKLQEKIAKLKELLLIEQKDNEFLEKKIDYNKKVIEDLEKKSENIKRTNQSLKADCQKLKSVSSLWTSYRPKLDEKKVEETSIPAIIDNSPNN